MPNENCRARSSRQVQPGRLFRTCQIRFRIHCQCEEEVAMPLADRIRVSRDNQLLARIFAHRLQHPVAVAIIVGDDERLLDQADQDVDDVVLGDRLAAAHSRSRPRASSRRRTPTAARTAPSRRRRAARSSSRSARAASDAAAARGCRSSAGGSAGRASATICSTGSTATRAAASSSASGIPSSRTQISATARACFSCRSKRGRCCCARSTNSRTASARAMLAASDFGSGNGRGPTG